MSRARELADAGSKANFLDNVSSDINTQFTTINSSLSSTSGKVTSFVGCIQAFAQTTAPTGWLVCDGSSNLNTYTYRVLHAVISNTWGGTAYNAGTTDQNGETTTFTIPDLRGEFLRGFNNGAGIDPDAGSRTGGDAVGSSQGDSVKTHYHGIEARNPHTGGAGAGNRPVAGNIGYPQNNIGTVAHVFNFAQTNRAIPYGFLQTYSVGGEGRPRNKYVQYCIRWQD